MAYNVFGSQEASGTKTVVSSMAKSKESDGVQTKAIIGCHTGYTSLRSLVSD